MRIPKRFANVPAIPEGKECLILVPYYWGKGKTFDEAYANLREAGSNASTGRAAVYAVTPTAYVTDLGYICDTVEPVVLAKVGY
jgi:hypothetical protein